MNTQSGQQDSAWGKAPPPVWLAQNRYFEDPAFVSYLEYLLYWKEPKYAKYLQYPHALFFLELLQSPDFRKEIARSTVTEFIHTQQFRFWQHGGKPG
ncbi:SOH1-domain-containing protein [Dunaliella salina]|uniref:Mediator of RNA polymerase II transcription subunit 31 n=1 Tax=Dunaliella salina TaxID=3046 RepID=A0ABQ7G7R1_DUNSA|nr:SOH1-domain-containing protein [Dunaliella salina]|eukprot:KAF5830643.1 SOH1-domain-containing protein [Dunaliella salina]